MSEPRIVNIIEFLDRSSRVINLKIKLRMTALQFGIRHSTNKPDALQNRGRLSKRLMQHSNDESGLIIKLLIWPYYHIK